MRSFYKIEFMFQVTRILVLNYLLSQKNKWKKLYFNRNIKYNSANLFVIPITFIGLTALSVDTSVKFSPLNFKNASNRILVDKKLFSKKSGIIKIPTWRYHDIDTAENWKRAEIFSRYIK